MNNEIFARVHGAYDLPLMAASRVVLVGTGGSRGVAEDLARSGIGEFALIDPDVSSLTNVATQNAFCPEDGRHKVDCVSDRLLRINPAIGIMSIADDFTQMSQDALHDLLCAPWSGAAKPRQTLLIMTTDVFNVQAHGNRVALHFGVPLMAAQMYEHGFGGEVVFTHPEVTLACGRCATAMRYKAYLEQNFVNQVGSHATGIFSTTMLNGLCTMIALALLHHPSEHPRWQGILERMGNRNLVQMQLWPDTDLPAFAKVYGQADGAKMLGVGNTVWLPQKPDHPDSNGLAVCPDCGGTGNLYDSVGAFAHDLHAIRKQHPSTLQGAA
jgi:hypothetical protein